MPTPPGPMGTNAPAQFVRNAVRTRPTPVETAPSGHVSAVALGMAKVRRPSSKTLNAILLLHILFPFPLHIVFLSRGSCSRHVFDSVPLINYAYTSPSAKTKLGTRT